MNGFMPNKTFVTRAYNNIALCTHEGTITKQSTDARLKKESEYYSLLPPDLRIFFPRKVGSNLVESCHSLTLEYFGYPNLGKLMIDTSTNSKLWKNIGENLLYILSRFAEDTLVVTNSEKCRRDMLIEKTQREYKNLVCNFEIFQKLAAHQKIIINGKEYANFETLWQQARPKLQKICTESPFSVVHGDMCFSNILCEPSTGVLRLIDPRGSFGVDGVYGDRIYDAAKLLHSIEGKYELIIYDHYDLDYNIDQGIINYVFKEHKDTTLLREKIFSDFDENVVRLVMSTIFIGMCARHYDSLSRQLVMYSTGIKAMTEALECM